MLLELRNDDLQLEMRELELAVSQAAALHRCALNERDAGQAQVVLRNQEALLERLAEKRQRCDRLRVYAPVGGRIVARNLRNLLGTYVEEGTELLAVGDERRKELRVSIAQDQVDEVLPLLGQTTRFRVGDCRIYAGTLSRIEPRASRELPHPALSATVGGPLSVKAAAERDGPTESQLVEPRFPGVVTLAPEMCGQLACGDRGYALFGLRRSTPASISGSSFPSGSSGSARAVEGRECGAVSWSAAIPSGGTPNLRREGALVLCQTLDLGFDCSSSPK